jgi:Bacterial type II and III secretion system protein
MRHHPLRIVTLAAVLLCVVALTGHSGTPKQIEIEARFVEFSNPRFDAGMSHYPFLQTDKLGGLTFKTGMKFKKNGEKHRGIRMKAKQNGAQGFFSLGREFSATDPITVSGTIQLQSMKGIEVGSTFGIEFDSPFVPVGGSFDNFLFVGAAYESGGLRAFTSLNGTNVGMFPFFSNAMSLDFQAEIDSEGVTVDVRPSDSSTWSNLVTDLGFALDRSVGVGFGLSRVDKGARVIAGDIRIEGPSIWANPILTPILADVDALRLDLAGAHTAMTRMGSGGKPDPDISTAESHLISAAALRDSLAEDIAAARLAGTLHPNTPYDDVLKKLDKAEGKLVPVLGEIPLLGELFRNKDAKRVRKTDLLILVTAKLLTVGEED